MQPVPPEGALVLWHLPSWFGGCYRITSLTWCLPVLPWYGLGSPSLSGSFTDIDLPGDSWETVGILQDTEPLTARGGRRILRSLLTLGQAK